MLKLPNGGDDDDDGGGDDYSELKQRRSVERRMSTVRGLFFFSFLDNGFAQSCGKIVSVIVKTLRDTNLIASRCFRMKKTLLPVGMRRSNPPLLKLPKRKFKQRRF